MRKTTELTVKAFLNGETKKVGNTESTGTELKLHGNVIASKTESGGIAVTLASWPTPTTRERLNGLCELLGLGRPFHQHRHEQYYRDLPINSDDLILLEQPS